jgi:hypothetical protein
MRFTLVLAGAALAGGALFATPAAATVKFDPATKTGFVGKLDVQRSFGWDDAALRARTGRITFTYDTLTKDTYSVVCGRAGNRPFTVLHDRVFARDFLNAVVVRDTTAAPSGFRITGAGTGISGTTVGPTVGLPCPEEGKGKTVRSARVVSTAFTGTLSANFGGVSKTLWRGRG